MGLTENNPFRIGNLTINNVLDGIVEISQIDPTWVQPDHSFSQDLQISAEDILQISLFATRHLNLSLSEGDQCEIRSSRTPRELVQKIEFLIEKKTPRKAG